MLGSLLLLALLALVILMHKHYGPWFQCCSSKALVSQGAGGQVRGEAEAGGDERPGQGCAAKGLGCGLQTKGGGGGRAEDRGGTNGDPCLWRGLGRRLRPGPGSLLMPRLLPPPQEAQPYGFDNKAFLPDDDREPSWAPAPSPVVPSGIPTELPVAPPVPAPATPPPPVPAPPSSPSSLSPGQAPESPAAGPEERGPAGVRSILTKERRPEGGYKAVWFGENIGAEADVVVLNAPISDADGASDSGSDDGSDRSGDEDEDADAGPGWEAHADSTYI